MFSELTSNPKDYEVENGVKQYIESECDAIVGVGGGSAIDVAKSIAIVATNGAVGMNVANIFRAITFIMKVKQNLGGIYNESSRCKSV